MERRDYSTDGMDDDRHDDTSLVDIPLCGAPDLDLLGEEIEFFSEEEKSARELLSDFIYDEFVKNR